MWLYLGHNGLQTVMGKMGGFVVHDTFQVIVQAVIGTSRTESKKVLPFFIHVLPQDGDVLITVPPALFMQHAQSMQEEVNDDAGFVETGSAQDQVLLAHGSA